MAGCTFEDSLAVLILLVGTLMGFQPLAASLAANLFNYQHLALDSSAWAAARCPKTENWED